MSELDKLSACIEDGCRILAINTEEDLRDLFRDSKTNVAGAFENGVEGLLEQWPDDESRIGKIRAYLLWNYIAYNISELYNGFDLTREILEDRLQKKDKD